MKRYEGRRKSWICGMAMCIGILLAACGKDVLETQTGSKGDPAPVGSSAPEGAPDREWVYVPERIELEDGKADYDGMQLIGDTACYVTMNGEAGDEAHRVCRYSLRDRKLQSAPIVWPMEGSYRDVVTYVFNPDCSVWLIVNVYPADFGGMRRYLCKFDAEGRSSVSKDVTEQLKSGISMSDMAVDGQGRLYVFSDEYSDQTGIWLYEADGSYHGSIFYEPSENVRFRGAASGENGGLQVCVGKGMEQERCSLEEVDFEGKRLTEVAADFPAVTGLCAWPAGAEDNEGNRYDLLVYDEWHAYGYDLAAHTGNGGQISGTGTDELFAWMDSDINGYYVTGLGLLEDGRYCATVEDWAGEDRSIVLLTKTRAEDAPKRVNLVLATVDGESDMVGMAMRINRGNAQYHVTVKKYDSVSDLYNAMLTKEPVDLVDLSGIHVERLAAGGAFADLTPYVDQSSAFKRADFVEGLLDVYDFDSTLVGIPEAFTLRTAMGDGTRWKAADGAAGLTLDAFLATGESATGEMLFDEITKEEMMQYIMLFNEDIFIDWDTGECYFDSDTFRAVLELVSRFPDEIREDKISEEISLPTKIQNGEVCFAIADIQSLKALQPYMGMFGANAACVGFPTADGSGGTLLFCDNAFGIAAVSEHKEEAWEFVEAVLTRPKTSQHVNTRYFPAMRADLDAKVDERIREDAEWAARHGDRDFLYGRLTWEDGWSFDYLALSREEVDRILALVPEAVPARGAEGDAILRIISEEAPAYYSGQKSADAVARVIQNRVHLYVSENR
ncbi:MAG: hypothetical protein NC079_06750 [Clostridium sp.]|nr:hypothetical protein [Acetatifactor muris]MCM1526910.1 hypothetical protein [Bacteroides sp.]MCM1563296.1 hypothetical protein [Clostridium sp.]